jgi:hypothetical protein
MPNTDDLGLEKAGVAVDQPGYIQVDDQLRTNVAASTRWANATAEEPSHTRLTTIMRSSPATFWTVTGGA